MHQDERRVVAAEPKELLDRGADLFLFRDQRSVIAFRVGVFEIDRRGNDGVTNGEGAGVGLASVKTGRCPRLGIDFDVHEACGVDQYSLEIGP